ncbi:hypothetical protein [Xenorhabdus griffiniae]|uniref:hypothetical protein n=1 Tax=Xenorhabdus griffiniae TaxID=351672 RepID=UPI002358AD90|nr:hypothetical protein [Xenorhabdus griffiniae]MDC9605642.1 hypothetical protein [Xenorhabdus griffiniae]
MGSVDGMYISEDHKHILTIINSSDTSATFGGSFTSSCRLTGEVSYSQLFGQYRFVADNQEWPAQISFYSILAPTPPLPRKYVIADHWNGIRTGDGNILVSGLRTYTTDVGLYDIYTFEKILFTLTPAEK